MRFHLDEYINHAVAHGLRLRGIDVTTTTEAQLLNAEDRQHIEYAALENCAIVTIDADFLVPHQQGIDHRGIVYALRDLLNVGDLVRGLLLINACITDDEMVRHLEFLLQDD